MKSEHFKQAEFQQAIARHVVYGIETPMAERADCHVGTMSRYLSPNEEAESTLFKSACVFTAWLDQDCENGQKALDTFNNFIAKALPCDDSLDLKLTREQDMTETTEFSLSVMNQDDLDEQIREGEESVAARQRHVQALKAERERRNQRLKFPGQPVRHTAVSLVKQAVNGGKRG